MAVVNTLKKLIVIFMCVIVFCLPFISSAKQTHAIGVIGSNAVKNVVISSMEKSGVQFTSKQAKDKAFDAWNMKAYNKWKEDEAAGRNADLWAQWHSFEQNPNAFIKAVPDPKPSPAGFGRMLLESSIFGLAISIGAEIGFAIEDAQNSEIVAEKFMEYLSSDIKTYNGIDYGPMYNLTFEHSTTYNSYFKMDTHHRSYYMGKSKMFVGAVHNPYHDGAHIAATGVEDMGSYYRIKLRLNTFSGEDPMVLTNYANLNKSDFEPHASGGYPYKFQPLPEDVPHIAPAPELAPLIAPKPDLAVIPEVLPPAVPVEILLPDDGGLWEGVVNEPYTPPGKPVEPVKPPVKPPGTTPTPGQDPNKKPIPETVPEPGAIKDPFEEPKEIKEENLSCERVQRPDFKPLGNAFTTSFPFSLPWDLKRYLDASFSGIGSEKPKFALPFFGDGVEITIPDELDKYVSFLKSFILIVFDLSIIYLFVRVMRGGSD